MPNLTETVKATFTNLYRAKISSGNSTRDVKWIRRACRHERTPGRSSAGLAEEEKTKKSVQGERRSSSTSHRTAGTVTHLNSFKDPLQVQVRNPAMQKSSNVGGELGTREKQTPQLTCCLTITTVPPAWLLLPAPLAAAPRSSCHCNTNSGSVAVPTD